MHSEGLLRYRIHFSLYMPVKQLFSNVEV